MGDDLSTSANSCVGRVARRHHHFAMVVVGMGTSSEQRRDEWMVSSKAGEGSVEKKPVGGSWQRSWKGVGME